MHDLAEHATAVGSIILLVAFLTLAAADKVIPFRSSAQQSVAMLAIIVIAGVTFVLTRPATPPISSVNGTYRNACCEPVILKDGELIAAHFKVPFKLRLMKYGLDTEMERNVEVRDGKVLLSERPGKGGFLFANDVRGFTLCAKTCGPNNEFEFRR